MKLKEFDTMPGMSNRSLDKMPAGLYDASSDTISTADIMDTRKNKLTLRDLNKLAKLRSFRKLEALKHEDSLELMYGDVGSEDGGMM